MRRAIFTLAALLALSAPAAAQQLTLNIKDGRVNLDATSVPVRQILAEWAKVGGTKVVNGERVAGAPITVKLLDVPEKQALEIVLRNVAGYLAAPRSASAAPGASLFDRIMVLPTSAAPVPAAASGRQAPSAPPPGTAADRAGLQRFVPPRPPVLNSAPAAEEVNEEVETIENDAEPDDQPPGQPPVFSFPQPGQPAMPGQPQAPGSTFSPVQPSPTFGQPATGTAPSTPGSGSSVPGVITNPQPTTPGQPRPTTRPPGSGGSTLG